MSYGKQHIDSLPSECWTVREPSSQNVCIGTAHDRPIIESVKCTNNQRDVAGGYKMTEKTKGIVSRASCIVPICVTYISITIYLYKKQDIDLPAAMAFAFIFMLALLILSTIAIWSACFVLYGSGENKNNTERK
jgi:hypothetical protein